MKLKPFGSLCLIKILPEAEEKAAGTVILIPRDAAAMPLDNIIEDEDGASFALVQPNTIIATIHE